MREISTNAIAIYEKVVLSVLMPIARKAMPRIKKTVEILRLFSCMMNSYLDLTSGKFVKLPLKRLEVFPFNVSSKKSSRYELTISTTRVPCSGPFNPSCGAMGESKGRSLKS